MARHYLQLYWRLSGVTRAPVRHRRRGLVR
jgi:hypothetical protein